MSTVEAIERAVRALKPEERARSRAWFAEFDASLLLTRAELCLHELPPGTTITAARP